MFRGLSSEFPEEFERLCLVDGQPRDMHYLIIDPVLDSSYQEVLSMLDYLRLRSDEGRACEVLLVIHGKGKTHNYPMQTDRPEAGS